MSDFPTYIRLVGGKSPDRTSPLSRPQKPRASSGDKESTAAPESKGDVVSIITRENLRSSQVETPSALEAEEAIGMLLRDLSQNSGDLGEIHSNLDRKRILQLLAPLVD